MAGRAIRLGRALHHGQGCAPWHGAACAPLHSCIAMVHAMHCTHGFILSRYTIPFIYYTSHHASGRIWVHIYMDKTYPHGRAILWETSIPFRCRKKRKTYYGFPGHRGTASGRGAKVASDIGKLARNDPGPFMAVFDFSRLHDFCDATKRILASVCGLYIMSAIGLNRCARHRDNRF